MLTAKSDYEVMRLLTPRERMQCRSIVRMNTQRTQSLSDALLLYEVCGDHSLLLDKIKGMLIVEKRSQYALRNESIKQFGSCPLQSVFSEVHGFLAGEITSEIRKRLSMALQAAERRGDNDLAQALRKYGIKLKAQDTQIVEWQPR